MDDHPPPGNNHLRVITAVHLLFAILEKRRAPMPAIFEPCTRKSLTNKVYPR